MWRVHSYHNTCLINLPPSAGIPPLLLQISHSKSQSPNLAWIPGSSRFSPSSHCPLPTERAQRVCPTALVSGAAMSVNQPEASQAGGETWFIQVRQLAGSHSDPGLVSKGVDRLALSLAIDDLDGVPCIFACPLISNSACLRLIRVSCVSDCTQHNCQNPLLCSSFRCKERY